MSWLLFMWFLFPVELDKPSFCILQVTNNTEHHVAFKVHARFRRCCMCMFIHFFILMCCQLVINVRLKRLRLRSTLFDRKPVSYCLMTHVLLEVYFFCSRKPSCFFRLCSCMILISLTYISHSPTKTGVSSWYAMQGQIFATKYYRAYKHQRGWSTGRYCKNSCFHIRSCFKTNLIFWNVIYIFMSSSIRTVLRRYKSASLKSSTNRIQMMVDLRASHHKALIRPWWVYSAICSFVQNAYCRIKDLALYAFPMKCYFFMH